MRDADDLVRLAESRQLRAEDVAEPAADVGVSISSR